MEKNCLLGLQNVAEQDVQKKQLPATVCTVGTLLLSYSGWHIAVGGSSVCV